MALRINKGSLFGGVLSLSLSSLAIGLPLVMVYLIIFFRKIWPSRFHTQILILLAIKVIWVVGVYCLFSGRSLNYVFVSLSADLIMLAMLFVPMSVEFLKGLAKPLVLLFLVDFLFNLSIIVTGVDILGRPADFRAGDFLPRLGGVFAHAFYSVNISAVGLIMGLMLSRNWVIALSLAALLVNGTLRAPLMFFLFLSSFVLLKMKVHKLILFSFLFCYALLVFGLTAYSSSMSDTETGNFLRLAAWGAAIIGILDSPVIGKHDFLSGPHETMNVQTILDFGIAESYYLQTALDFGVLPAVTSLLVLYMVLSRCVSQYHSGSSEGLSVIPALLACIIFTDTFYGSLLGSVVVVFVYGSVCLSGREAIFIHDSKKY